MNSVFRLLLSYVNKHFLLVLVITYLLAACAPTLGKVVGHTYISTVRLPLIDDAEIFLPTLLLMLMIFIANLAIREQEGKAVFSKPALLIGGFSTNLLLPLCFILLLCIGTRIFQIDGTALILGLSIIASMPIANSTLVWSQNTGGNVALSLGLVLASTLFSPVTAPLLFGGISLGLEKPIADLFQHIALTKTSPLLVITVVFPSILGLLSRMLIGEIRLKQWQLIFKLINLLVMVFLIYVNAVTVLPQLSWSEDSGFILSSLVFTALLSGLGFFFGKKLGIALNGSNSECSSLMYALGMNSSVVGLVLSMNTLGSYPKVMVPILCYNLVQQVLAAILQQNPAQADSRRSPNAFTSPHRYREDITIKNN